MRIVHLCLGCFYIDGFTYQENLLPKYHLAMGHEVFIFASPFTFDKNGEPINIPEKDCNFFYESEGIKIKRFPYKKGGISRVLRFYKTDLFSELEAIKPDVIFVHGIQFADSKKVVKYKKQYKDVKIYVDNHADFLNSGTSFISKNILHKIVWRYFAKRAEPYVEKFYGVLPARVDFLHDVYGISSQKIELLPFGAEDEKVEEACDPNIKKEYRQRIDVGTDDILIIAAGKVDRNKAEIQNLVEAVNLINNDRIKLRVFGSVINDMREEFLSKFDGEKTKYMGWLEPKDTYKVFCCSDLIVFPGKHSVYWEQAAGSGVPCVYRKIDGFTHIDKGGNCVLIESGSTEELKETISELAIDYKKLDQLKKSANSAKKYFSYKDIAKKSII